jgi:hypothetical protein
MSNAICTCVLCILPYGTITLAKKKKKLQNYKIY